MIPHINHWALWAATEAEAAEGVVPAWVKLLLTAAVFLVPYALGVFIARQLKLKEYAFKISVVLCAATLGVMPFVYQGILGEMERQHYENQLQAWKEARKESPLKPADIAELQEEYRQVNLVSPERQTPPPAISSPNE